MNRNYLCNEESVSGYPQDATGQTVYAPGEMLIKYTGTEKDVVVPEGIKAIGDDDQRRPSHPPHPHPPAPAPHPYPIPHLPAPPLPKGIQAKVLCRGALWG